MLYFTIQNRLQAGTSKVSEAAGARWRFYRRISSDYRRIILESSFYWRKHFREFPMKSWASRFRGRRSIWWGWRVTWLAPRIGNDVICDADHWWHWFCVAGAVFGEVGGSFCVAGQYLVRLAGDFSWQAQHFVTFWEIAGTRNVVFNLQYKIVSKLGRVRSPKRRVRDDDFIVGYRRIMVESSFYWRKHSGSIRWNLELQDFVVGAVFGEVGGWLDLLRALEMTFHMWRRPLMTLILCGRCSIWWGWRVILCGRRIVNDVSK